MMYLIGTDEAGYGPNLGPLIISATVWRVPHDTERSNLAIEETPDDLYQTMSSCVTNEVSDFGELADERIVIADSKKLYRPGLGLEGLELGVLSCLRCLFPPLRTWNDIWDVVGADREGELLQIPWYRNVLMALPISACETAIAHRGTQLTRLGEIGSQLVAIESRAIFPQQFNREVDRLGNKATLLSQTTLKLVQDVMSRLDPAPVYVLCDKHGGRNRYGALIQSLFSDTWVQVLREGRSESHYRIGAGISQRDFIFRPGGESFLPSALASMVSKYLRELAMLAFNAYWCQQVPDLRPTAGYPVDAKRFKSQIAAKQHELGIEDQILWRCR